jgi:capsular exopolysaccharide synthesis family protein
MGRTHEALERAEKEYQESLIGAFPISQKHIVTVLPRRASNQATLACYEDLKTNLLTRRLDKPIKTILFTGTSQGDGASTTAINFAASLVKDTELRVLLVDANLRTPCLHEVFGVDHTHGLSDLLTKAGDMASRMKKIGATNLYVMPCGGKHSNPVSLFESSEFDQFLHETHAWFDFVILDAPPATSFSEARVICRKMDGVVLVLGSGTTRRQVALKAKKEIEEAGGKVLGVVLNRRKFHIPTWIYERL